MPGETGRVLLTAQEFRYPHCGNRSHMAKKVNPLLVTLVHEALLSSFHRKRSLRNFLRRAGIAESFLATLSDDETKREWLDRLFPELERIEAGQKLIVQLAQTLADQSDFPDLKGWEESARLVRAAVEAVAALRKFLEADRSRSQSVTAGGDSRKQAEEKRTQYTRTIKRRDELQGQLELLSKRIGTSEAGYAFQDWFYDVVGYSEIEHRRPYDHDGRNIDGSVTIDGTTYLVELKFQQDPAGAPDIDSLLSKVQKTADNTMGVMVAIAGYSAPAKRTASFARTPLLLLDHSHLYLVLTGIMSLADIIRRVRRHASQTGDAYLAAGEFGSV